MSSDEFLANYPVGKYVYRKFMLPEEEMKAKLDYDHLLGRLSSNPMTEISSRAIANVRRLGRDAMAEDQALARRTLEYENRNVGLPPGGGLAPPANGL